MRRLTLRALSAPLAATAALVLVSISLTSCSPDSDLQFFTNKVFYTSMGSFENWFRQENANALGKSTSTINGYWVNGGGTLDTKASKNRYWDVSTDFCSNSPDTAGWFDFKGPCARHDFSWRNLKKMDSRWKVNWFNTHTKRVATSEQFHTDMDKHCDGRAWTIRQQCYATSDTYYNAVLLAA